MTTRIKVRKHAACIVDLDADLATDLYSIGPVDLFSGKGTKAAVAKAAGLKPRRAAVNHSGFSNGKTLGSHFAQFVRDADLAVIREVEHDGVGSVNVTTVEGMRQKFNAEFWDVLEARSDCAMLDRRLNKPGPAVFFVDGHPFALVMPLWTPRTWREGKDVDPS